MEKKINDNAENLARCLKAMAHPLRLKIILFLESKEKSVGEIESSVGSSQSNISQHLGIMRDKNILVSRKEGNQIFYSLKDDRILPRLKEICQILIQNR
ncbi:MAG: ArsR/SmtB family transcription factor [bacterium]|jgi:DNA-binding transcriptional ArsR family regulator